MMLNEEILNSSKYLTREEVAKKAPSVFATKPSVDVSDKYTHIPTERVINDMEALGWKIIEAKEVKARKNTTKGFQKHLLVFRNDDVVIHGKDGDTVYPQILLTNSHDGKNSFQFQAGLYRLVCSNGLVIATEKFEDVKMRHMGYTFEDLQVKIKDMVERLPLTIESMNKMKDMELGQEQMLSFAQDALTSRFSKKELKRIDIDIEELLQPTRTEDRGNDLWSVFNVVQEKLITGDFNYRMGSKARKGREIKNFKQDMLINKRLFQTALSYAG
jgi:hypothetical protein